MSDCIISDLAQNIYELVDGIPEINHRVGLATGGRGTDPELSKTALPWAWILLEGIEATDERSNQQPSAQSMRFHFHISLAAKYESQAGLMLDSYPLVQKCMTSVRGAESPVGTKWRWEGTKLVEINPGRLIYAVRFSINAHL